MSNSEVGAYREKEKLNRGKLNEMESLILQLRSKVTNLKRQKLDILNTQVMRKKNSLQCILESSPISFILFSYLTPPVYFNLSSLSRTLSDLTQRDMILKFVDDRDD
jgi:hypothetical protein